MATVLAPAVRQPVDKERKMAIGCHEDSSTMHASSEGCLNELSQVWTNRCVRGQRSKHESRMRERRSKLVRPVERMWGGGARLSRRGSAWMDELAQPMDGDREVRGNGLLGKGRRKKLERQIDVEEAKNDISGCLSLSR
uniref:Uncharacterized protein n=1 Tax=Oryza sativa subsp. indica TaxID=39946 RepID=A0A679BBK7_ORYSI|nr:hypothetical protein [Oryza sativa Indica Group]BBD82452.1 hypothetical protein [Oryza sativa Indica Group]